MKNILLVIILFCLTFAYNPPSAASSTDLDNFFADLAKQSLADSQIMLNSFNNKKIPVYIYASCEDNKTIENRIISVMSKKLRELGDISLKDRPEQAAFHISIIALYNKPVNQVIMSIVVSANSVALQVLSDRKPSSQYPLKNFLTHWVAQNSQNSFSSNISEIIEQIDVDYFQFFRKAMQ